MGQKPGAGDPFEGLPIGTVISEDGLILSVPGGATDPKGRSTLGQVGTDFTRGGVKGIAGSLLSTAQQAGTTLAAANPVTFPLWLANKVGLVPKSVQQKVLPFAMPGYLPPEVQQQVDTSLQSKNLPETLGGFAADAATAFIGGGGGGLGPRIGRAVAEFLPVTKSKTLANVADKIGRGVTGRVGTPAALTEAEVAQAQSLRSIMPTQKSARTLQAEVRATTPPPNKSPINMRKIYRDEVPKRKGRNSRRQSTPEQVENTALRMMEEVEKRKGVSPFKDVATKMQAAADAPMAPPHWTELGAVLGPLLGTKALIPSGAGRLLGRPLPRGIASHVLSEYAGMAPLVGGERIRRETAGRVPDPAEEIRAGIINQLGQLGQGGELAAGVPSHEPAAAPALPPPAATPPPAPAAAPGLPRPNVTPVPLGRGVPLSAPPDEEAPDELPADTGRRSLYREAITDLLGQPGRAELPAEEAARPAAPELAGGPVFESKFNRIKERIKAETGLTLKVIAGRRTPEQQEKIYASGRTAPGPIRTDADGRKILSKHQSGEAVDLRFVDPSGKVLDLKGDDPLYKLLGRIAKEEGLVWGGDWKGEPGKSVGYDPSHLQLGSVLTRTK